MKDKLLPIGTVVQLKGGTKKLMITGYSSKDPDSGTIFDYNSCIFPEGIMEEVYSLFNHNQIEEIFYKGLENDESKDYANKIESMLLRGNTGKGLNNSRDSISGSSSNGTTSRRRTPKEPTNPRSKSEMMAKYGVKKSSCKAISSQNQ